MARSQEREPEAPQRVRDPVPVGKAFAEPWPERPAAKRQEREPEAPQIGRDPVPVGKAFAEPGPERPAAKRQEREDSSTSVETTGHLSVAL